MIKNFRNTKQFLMPAEKPAEMPGSYRIYPTHTLEDDTISRDFKSLAQEIGKHKMVIIDGYLGVFFGNFKNETVAMQA